MNIYLYELKANRKFTLSWIIGILFIMLVVMSFFPIFYDDMDTFIKMINNLPEGIKQALGMDPSIFGSILGYYAFVLTFIYICVCIEGMILGMSILSKEIREKTADFLLSKPVSRTQIITSKILSSLSLILISNIVLFIGFYIMILIFANASFSFSTYSLLTLTILFIQIIFFALGILISMLIPRIKAILTVSLGTVFGLYLLSTFTEDKLRVIMPFKYFDLNDILVKNTYDLKYIIISFSVVIISIIITYIVYNKRDIQAV